MPQRGKRKAQTTSTSPKSLQPRKKINLNGTSKAVTRSTRQHRSPEREELREDDDKVQQEETKVLGSEETPAEYLGSLPPLLSNSSVSTPSLSLSTFRSSLFSQPFSSFKSSSPSANGNESPPGLLSRIRSFLPARKRYLMNSARETVSKQAEVGNGKGKERAVDTLDEEGNLSAEESARMIELLDSPVSTQWQSGKSNGRRVDREASQGDNQSGSSVEDLLAHREDELEHGQSINSIQHGDSKSSSDHLRAPTDSIEETANAPLDHLSNPEHGEKVHRVEEGLVNVEEDELEPTTKEAPVINGTTEDDAYNVADTTQSNVEIVEKLQRADEDAEEGSEVSSGPIKEELLEDPTPLEGISSVDIDTANVPERADSDDLATPERRIEVIEDERSVQDEPISSKREPTILEDVEVEMPPTVVPVKEAEEAEFPLEKSQPDEELLENGAASQEEGVFDSSVQQAFEVANGDEEGDDEPLHVAKGPSQALHLEELGGGDETGLEREADEGEILRIPEEEDDGESQQDEEAEEVSDGSDEEDDEILLFPKSNALSVLNKNTDVIDLTDSVDSLVPEAIQEEVALVAAPPRQKASGYFANGTLAKEKRLSLPGLEQNHLGSASRAIQLIGQRQISTSSTPSKILSKPSTGFCKKEPIFSKRRRSNAKNIASSKINTLLLSLKTHAKNALHTPFIDEMLQKRVALAKVLSDEMPDEEVQIQHLREILKRSERGQRLSLRPARRQLKEKERLEREIKLMRRRALGIMGRQPLPTNLPPDQNEVVKQTFVRQGKIAQVVGAAVESRDIAKLKPGMWLNDEVINFYTKLILGRSDDAVKKRAAARVAKKRLGANTYASDEERTSDIAIVRDVKRIWNGVWNVWTFTSFFYEKLSKDGYSGVRQWTRKVDIFTKDLILLPINIGQAHWVCAAINMRKHRFEYYDSMHARNPKVFMLLRNYLQAEYADKKKKSAGPLLLSGWKNYFSKQSPNQANGFDCGVFATMTMEQLSRRSPSDGELKDDLNVETVVEQSRELANNRPAEDDDDDESSSESDEDDNDGKEEEKDEEEEEEEEWNFSQKDVPYLRRLMVYEIASSRLVNE